MVPAVRQRWFAGAFAGLVLATACSDPQSPKSLTPNAQLSPPGGGTIAVDVSTRGSADVINSTRSIDPDGYTAWVDYSLSQAVGTNGLVAFSGLAAGDHTVALYGIASNCTVSTLDKGANNPRPVSLIDGVMGSTDFSLECVAWGGLTVRTNTTGVDLDADGYTITVDGGAGQAIATNGSVTFTTLYEGSHSVTLSGVAGNCTLSGAHPRTVIVTPGSTASMTFSASCVPIGSGSGSLMVTTTTTGSNLDPDGYTVTFDGSFSQPIAANESLTFTGPAGDHPVALSGVASNCTVSDANPRTVTVLADGTATTTFSVTCGPPLASVIGKGQLGMGTPTPGNNVQTFDFDVRADGTGRFTIVDYSNIHATGLPARLITDPSADPATSITAYRDSSSACGDPSRGTEFDGIGREDEGVLVSYTVLLCDDGPAGSGTDLLSFFISAEGFGRSGIVTSGDIAKR